MALFCALGGFGVFVGEGAAVGLGKDLRDLAGLRVRATRAGGRVDDAIHLAEVGLDGGDDFRLHRIRKGVATEGAGVEAGGLRFGLESSGVIPAGSAAAVFLGRFFKEHADGRRATAKGRRDAGGEAVTRGRTDDEDLLRPVRDGAAALHDSDLVSDVLGAAGGVRGGADESTDFGGDDHRLESGNRVPLTAA